MKNCKYYSSSWFILSVWPSVCRWNDVDNFVLISNILFSSFVNFAANYSPLSEITLSRNSCNFYILSLNNYANSSANVSFIIITKYVILDNLLQTTRTVSFLATNSNFMIKSIIGCVYSFSGILLNFNFSTSASVLFFLLYTNYNYLCIFLCFLSLLATSNSSLPTLLSSIFLYVLLLVHHGITRLSPLLISHSLVYKLSLSLIPTCYRTRVWTDFG